MHKRIALLTFALLGLTACAGRVFAPHLSREQEMAPAAAAERYGAVLDKAAAFEKQNTQSRDLPWYRAWRAAGMIGLGQAEQAGVLLEEIHREVSVAVSPPAQADRLRMFLFELQAKVALARGQPAEALGLLERAFAIAAEVPLESRGPCDRDVMLAARLAQLAEVARAAGSAGRAASATDERGRALGRWARCLAAVDYPGMAPIEALAQAVTSVAAPLPVAPLEAPPAVAPVAAPVVAPKPAPAAAQPPPPPPPPAPEPMGLGAIPLITGTYAPVNPSPYQPGLDAVAPLLRAQHKDTRTEIVIRTDGHHHALRVLIPRKYARPEELVPAFKGTMAFFEAVRAVTPKVDRVMVSGEGFEVMATFDDVLDLFLERIDERGFVGRLKRTR